MKVQGGSSNRSTNFHLLLSRPRGVGWTLLLVRFTGEKTGQRTVDCALIITCTGEIHVSILFWCLCFIVCAFSSIFPLNKLNHAGCSVLAVISRMPTDSVVSIHFFSVLGAFEFHGMASYLGYIQKTQREKQYIYAAEPPLSRFFR